MAALSWANFGLGGVFICHAALALAKIAASGMNLTAAILVSEGEIRPLEAIFAAFRRNFTEIRHRHAKFACKGATLTTLN